MNPVGPGDGKCLIFTLANRYFAIDMRRVRRVVTLHRLYKVPLARANFDGLIRFEERAIPLFDLQGALGLKGEREEGEPLVAVQQLPQGEVGILIGGGHLVAQLSEGADIEKEPELPGVEKVIEWEGKEISLLNMEELIGN